MPAYPYRNTRAVCNQPFSRAEACSTAAAVGCYVATLHQLGFLLGGWETEQLDGSSGRCFRTVALILKLKKEKKRKVGSKRTNSTAAQSVIFEEFYDVVGEEILSGSGLNEGIRRRKVLEGEDIL